MKQYVTESTFIDAFKQSDTRKNQFSYEGLKALFEYFEEYEDSTGEELEFDMIAICCEYTEYDNLKELNNNYSKQYKDLEELREETEVIVVDYDKFIIRDF
jgi:hypothetical protein|tara:strand:+ start:191 stop:493 length:303 start_codon:yes stop_codon:yes gene_type:complete